LTAEPGPGDTRPHMSQQINSLGLWWWRTSHTEWAAG
jgi:hypothetical protein